MPGQAVDQIDIDRTHAAVAARAQDVQRLPHALHAIDRFLHLRVEILHTQAGAVETEPGKHRHVAGVDESRVQFDGKITLRGIAEIEAAAQAFDQCGHRIGIQEIRRAAAEVQLDHFTAVGELRCQQVRLGQHA